MWTLFLIITLNADLGGISSHEIATFEKLEDCAWEGLQLSIRSQAAGNADEKSMGGGTYVVQYKCLPTKTKSD